MPGYQSEKFCVSYQFTREKWIVESDSLAQIANIIVHELAGVSSRKGPLSFIEMSSIVKNTKDAYLGSKEIGQGKDIGNPVYFEVILHGKTAFKIRTKIASPQILG